MRAFLLFLLLFVSGCATTATEMLPRVDEVQYRVGAGDKLQVTVFREENLSGEFTVDERGLIALPLVGTVAAGGKTVEELRTELTRVLGQEYVRDPRVTVAVVNYRPVFILGEVQKPGEYAYGERMTIYALVAKAGGFTFRADEKVAYVRHERDAEERAYRLTSGAAVLPGDTIRIGSRIF